MRKISTIDDLEETAFPLVLPTEFRAAFSGMTMLDAFAIAALIGIGNWTPSYGRPVSDNKPFDDPTVQAARARWAYDQAAAMIAVRKELKKESEPDGRS